MWCLFCLAIGLGAFLNYLYDNLKSPAQLLYHKWLEYQNQNKSLTERYGKWAAITGSTDGIGKAYARELARHGFNIVLVARNDAKLQQVAKEIETEFSVEVVTIHADFALGSQIYNKLFQDISQKPIGLLVNNVGIGHDPPGVVWSFSSHHLWDVLNVNIGAATQLSRHFVDIWQRNGTKGCIVNVSSGSELQPCPYGAVYAASKAYIRSFTLALQLEVASLGIEVQLLSPNFVSTKINCYSEWIMKGNLLIPSADVFAKEAVRTLGKVSVTTGYKWHGIQNSIMKLVPITLRSNAVLPFFRACVDDLSNIEINSKATIHDKSLIDKRI